MVSGKLTATVLTVVLEDGSKVYDLALSQDDESIRISMGSLNGCMDVIATLNNHTLESMNVVEDTCRY